MDNIKLLLQAYHWIEDAKWARSCPRRQDSLTQAEKLIERFIESNTTSQDELNCIKIVPNDIIEEKMI